MGTIKIADCGSFDSGYPAWRRPRSAQLSDKFLRKNSFITVEGPVDRILGSHQTVDVSITESTSHDSYRTQTHTFGYEVSPDSYQTQTHTFVNTSREFVVLLEVEGRTLRLVSNDYIAVAVGDNVRAICEPVADAPLLILDWFNETRSIRFRTIPMPLVGAGADMASAGILVVASALCLYFDFAAEKFTWIALGAVSYAGLLAVNAWRIADRLDRTHAELSRMFRNAGLTDRSPLTD